MNNYRKAKDGDVKCINCTHRRYTGTGLINCEEVKLKPGMWMCRVFKSYTCDRAERREERNPE